MRITVVPAQVTTVEDRIMGNLSFSQMLLLVAPVFLGAMLYAGLPPMMGGSLYKYIVIGLLFVSCAVLAIRIRGKILALWLTIILKFNLRPQFYLFDKNSLAGRKIYPTVTEPDVVDELLPVTEQDLVQSLTDRQKLEVLKLLEKPAVNLTFNAKKGGLRVRFTEIQAESQR